MTMEDRDGFIWMDGEWLDWRDAKIHVLTHTLHYGMGAFEGVRAYETEDGPAIFRLDDHTNRLFNSTKILGMKIPFNAEILNKEQVLKKIPYINGGGRYPIMGALLQRRGGTARHDAVAWGYARAAENLGVDIIQNCEVKGINVSNGVVTGLETSRGSVNAKKVGLVPAGHSSVLANMAGFSLPINSVPLQALVSEPIKPILDCVIMSNAVHVYVSQSDKGEIVVGAGSDAYNSYSQRGSFDMIEHIMGPLVELFPIFSRLKMLRQWGGIVDITPDRSPIIGKTPVENLFINCGWGTGGFKATPGSAHTFAETVATGEPSKIAAPFSIDRHYSGALVDEAAAAAVAH